MNKNQTCDFSLIGFYAGYEKSQRDIRIFAYLFVHTVPKE